jgi:hypothetical protein
MLSWIETNWRLVAAGAALVVAAVFVVPAVLAKR